MIKEQSKIRSRSRSQMSVKVTDDSRLFFRSNDCKSPDDIADVGTLMSP